MLAPGQVWGPSSEDAPARRVVVLAVEGGTARFVYLGDQALAEKSVAVTPFLNYAARLEELELPEPIGDEDARLVNSDPVNAAKVLALLGAEGRDFAFRALKTARRLNRKPVPFARELLCLLVADRAGATLRVLREIENPHPSR